MKMVIDYGLRENVGLKQSSHYQNTAIRFIFTKKDLEEMKKSEKESKYKIIEKSFDETNLSNTVTNSADRHGYFIYISK